LIQIKTIAADMEKLTAAAGRRFRAIAGFKHLVQLRNRTRARDDTCPESEGCSAGRAASASLTKEHLKPGASTACSIAQANLPIGPSCC
jgi:hypothetical protein